MPADLSKRVPDEPPSFDAAEIGAFRQGTPFSQWALARYLVGRALGISISNNLLVVAALMFGFAAVLQWVVKSTFWAVVVAIIGVIVLAVRSLLRWALTKITAADHYAPLEARLRSLVAETQADIFRELRRVGLPGHTWSVPLLVIKLLRPSKRRDTLARLKQFDVDRAVSPARVDELHHIMRAAFDRPGTGEAAA